MYKRQDEVWDTLKKYTPKEQGKPSVPNPLWYNNALKAMKHHIQVMVNDRRNADKKHCRRFKRKPTKRRFTDVDISTAQAEYKKACDTARKASFQTHVSGLTSQADVARFCRAISKRTGQELSLITDDAGTVSYTHLTLPTKRIV